MRAPISDAEIEARIANHLDELMQLWWTEQGTAKPRDLALIASAIPFPRDRALSVLDLCCGPGDVGRAIRQEFPNAKVDFVDRDPFLTALCRSVNARERIPGRILLRDLNDEGWLRGLVAGDYDVVATANALHWLDAARAGQLFEDIRSLLRDGGVFLFVEPVEPEPPFAAGFEKWKAAQPPRYSREAWQNFWTRANALLGYDHIKLLGSRDGDRIGDDLSVAGWIDLVKEARFGSTDILLRDADEVIIAALKA